VVVATTGPELSCKGMVAMGSEPAGHDLRTVAQGATCQADRARILQALQHANGNRARTAKLLKISWASLYHKIRDYQIECPPSAALFPTAPFRPLKKLDALRR
jgi:DNA-binding NtrC family response regulator